MFPINWINVWEQKLKIEQPKKSASIVELVDDIQKTHPQFSKHIYDINWIHSCTHNTPTMQTKRTRHIGILATAYFPDNSAQTLAAATRRHTQTKLYIWLIISTPSIYTTTTNTITCQSHTCIRPFSTTRKYIYSSCANIFNRMRRRERERGTHVAICIMNIEQVV